MPNRLAGESSPYLLQHANNPVDWHPWGEEAFARARAEDKPVLLSVGYSACHWCHVMEHESFENAAIAGLMNEHFVSIKVDREERPDVDAIYMQAVQALSGRGGWPMTVFLTPDGRPFYGGTYYPPEDRHGLPGFPRLLLALAEAYRERPDDVVADAERLTAHIQPALPESASDALLTPALLDEAAQRLAAQFDSENGGFGGAPKFPPAMTLDFLLRHAARTGDRRSQAMVTFSLQKMARGGIHDQVGGGFHRYTVDAIWLTPHFEKMLYDNALLARLYLHAYQATGEPEFRAVVEDTLDYVLRDMTDPAGGFYSAEDADSEGEEGRFYLWTISELVEALGSADAMLVARAYGASAMGNFESSNILHQTAPLSELAAAEGMEETELRERLARARALLLRSREGRVRPARDDKVLTAWNALLLHSLADAAAALERDDYRAAAVRNAGFLLDQLRDGDRVLRTWKEGRAKIDGYLEDYALLADALLAVYALTFDGRWLVEARAVAASMVARFWDEGAGCFYDTAVDAAPLIIRPRDVLDNATPAGNSVAVRVLLQLGLLAGEPQPDARAAAVFRSNATLMTSHPSAFGELLGALDLFLGPVTELAIIGNPAEPGTRALLRAAQGRYLPNCLVLGRLPEDEAAATLTPLLLDRPQRDGLPTAYVCVGVTCGPPATDPEALGRELSASGAAAGR